MKWVCTVCGYVHEGAEPPAECPVCHVGADKFIKQEEGNVEWADKHVVGAVSYTHLSDTRAVCRCDTPLL